MISIFADPSNLLPLLPQADVMDSYRISNFAGQRIVDLLFIGSILAWSIMVTKFIEVRRAIRESARFLNAYKAEKQPLALIMRSQRLPVSPMQSLYLSVCEALNDVMKASGAAGAGDLLSGPGKSALKDRHVRALGRIADQIIVEEGIQLERNMGFLASAVTVAPFLGLLGTVWGVMDAFGGLAMTATASLQAVAPGVSGALLTTVVGLVVALPSSIGYNYLVARIRRLTIAMERFEQELLTDIELHYLE